MRLPAVTVKEGAVVDRIRWVATVIVGTFCVVGHLEAPVPLLLPFDLNTSNAPIPSMCDTNDWEAAAVALFRSLNTVSGTGSPVIKD